MILPSQRLVLELLEGYKTRFLEIRAAFGIGENIGFGSLPYSHSHYTTGVLTPASLFSPTEVEYKGSDGIGGDFPQYLSGEDLKRLIITPDFSLPDTEVVSVWDWSFQSKFTTLLLDGLVSHELAHIPDFDRKQLPQPIKHALAGIGDKYLNQKFSPDVNRECGVDILTALFGFKEATLAALDNSLMLHRNNAPLPLEDQAEVIASLQFRRDTVSEYC